MSINVIRRIVVDVETDASGNFTAEFGGWNGWYVYVVRFISPSSGALATASHIIIRDPDLGLDIWNKDGNYAAGSFMPLRPPNNTDGGANTTAAARRPLKIFDKIRVSVADGGNTNRATIEIYLTPQYNR